MTSFAKPENALKRAEELMNVGQKQAALQALHDLITSKRNRAWQKTLERIMFKYIELCVDMRKGRFAKDGLIQYRIVCHQVNVASLEEVIKHFLSLATEKAEQAQAQAAEVLLDMDDLEAEKRPEDLMLSYVSGEKGKDRSDRELVTPWFKFLWETYRTVLEILRNNSKLESLYAMTAHRAFQFCLQYKRTTEFRRLCEILRNHLANLNKYRDQRDRPDLTQPESLQLYLETRFEQLKVATELELWQEAFRSVEDIHGLMTLVKKTPKPVMMAVYYAKLTKIFWISESHLYHAYAWYKLYNLQKNYNRNLTSKDLQLMASSVLLATLAVTPYDHKHGAHHYELELEKDRNMRMANLLGFSLDPRKDAREALSRSALLGDLVSKGVLNYVPQEVKDLYHLLEADIQGLDLASRVQPLLQELTNLSSKLSAASPVPEVQLQQYVPALEQLATLRILQQASQVYMTMSIANLSKTIPFGPFTYVEKVIVDAAKCNFIGIKINYLQGTVSFGNQDLESDKIRNHLTILAKRLNKAVSLIRPPAPAPQSAATPSRDLLQVIEKEHKKLLARKVLIERRKEDQERQMLEMEKEEEKKKLTAQRMTEEAERLRLASESARREQERIQREIEEKEMEEARALLAEQEKKKPGKKLKKTEQDDKKPLSKQRIVEEALSEQIRERQEAERRMQKLSKTMDHLERARREEEAPLLDAAYKKKAEDDRIFHEQQQQKLYEESKEQYEKDVKEKSRLLRMIENKRGFQEQVMTRRRGEFEALRHAWEERVAELREQRHHERIQRRKMEYYRRTEEDRVRAEIEAQEAEEREEAERKRKEVEERERKLEEQAQRQRDREREVEERQRKEREDAAGPPPPAKFVPPSLRKKLDEKPEEADRPPVVESGDRWRAPRAREESASSPRRGEEEPSAERRYQPFGGRRDDAPPSSRDGGGGRFQPARDRDGPAPAAGRFEPARGRGGDAPRGVFGSSGGGDRWSRDGGERREGGGDRWGGGGARGGGGGGFDRGRDEPSRGADAGERPAPAAAASDGKWRPSRARGPEAPPR